VLLAVQEEKESTKEESLLQTYAAEKATHKVQLILLLGRPLSRPSPFKCS
jgi:hypothetical protein